MYTFKILHWLLVLSFAGIVFVVLYQGYWQAQLFTGETTFIINLAEAPLWVPPPVPTYATFQKTFQHSQSFPSDRASEFDIRRVLLVESTILLFLFYLWLITGTVSWLYRVSRGTERDIVLHVTQSAWVGLTAAALGCFVLWVLFGGWGPPAPVFFGSLGFVGGFIGGLLKFKRNEVLVNKSNFLA
jgi:hypothetical protein